MNKKVLISGYIGFENFGDDIILSSLNAYLKSKNFEVTALSSNPIKTKEVYGISAFAYKNPKAILKAVTSCDFLFSGGGSLLQNGTSNLSLIYYLSIIFLAKMFGKKVIIFAQGIGPIKFGLMRFFTKNILRMCDLITVRDSSSFELLTKWKINSNLLSDPAWDMKVSSLNQKGIVGVQLRPYSKMNDGFLNNLASYVNIFFPNRKILVFSLQNTQDEDICTKFVNLLKTDYNNSSAEVVLNSSFDKIVADFSKLEYLIAMRYHACLLGLKCGIKTLPVVYDIKVKNLAKEFKIDYINCEDNGKFDKQFENLTQREEIIQAEQKKFDWCLFDGFFEDKEKAK